MRIWLSVDGGFAALPGLRRPRLIDLDHAPADLAGQVRELLERVNFFGLPEQAADAPAGAADYRCYAITAEEGQQRHTVRVPEVGAPPELMHLIEQLEAM